VELICCQLHSWVFLRHSDILDGEHRQGQVLWQTLGSGCGARRGRRGGKRSEPTDAIGLHPQPQQVASAVEQMKVERMKVRARIKARPLVNYFLATPR